MAKTKAKSAAPKTKAAAAPQKTKPAKAKPAKAKKAVAPPAAATAPTGPSEGPWSLPRAPFAIQGYAFGEAYPTTMFHCVIPPTTRARRVELANRFVAMLTGAKGMHRLDPFEDPAEGDDREATAQWFVALVGRLQQLANLPVYASPRLIARGTQSLSFLIPTLMRGVQPTIDLLKLSCIAFAAKDTKGLATLREHAIRNFASLKASALTTSNTPRMVKAAIDNGIPFQELPASMIIFGVGRKSVLMDSTFTHECSNVGTRLAKYKHLSTAFLRRAGLPAPDNGIAQDEAGAVALANKLGYPVVVKPADKDGGIGVQADLRTDDEVRWAYEGARKFSSAVMVEKFFEGRDYRIVVFHGKAIWAKERQPAAVTGDGKSSIRKLVEAVNADPRRGSDVYAPLKKLQLDDEAQSLLKRDGMTFDSVPKKGELVRLRRRANVSSGGVPRPVTDVMHPDNARLAERTAELVGLDLAGVDLIMPDIAKSWREVPSAICEVNAQPELGGDAEHLYPQVLKELVQGNGHIPTIAVLGGPEAEQVTKALARALGAQGLTVGSHDRTGVYVGNETVVEGDLPVLRAGRMLTLDRRIDAIVLGSLDASVLRQGLPVLKIDVLLITGELPPTPDFAKERGEAALLPEALRLLAPHCRSVVALAAADECDPAMRAALEQNVKIARAVHKAQRQALLGEVVKRVVETARAG
jgi:cyanophycin synthetase